MASITDPFNTGSSFNLGKIKPKKEETIDKPAKSQRQIDCEAKGGTWDAQNKVCILPQPKQAPPKATATTPETFTDSKTGRASGITLPDGRTFLGLGPKDVADIAAAQAEKASRPEGTNPVGTAQQASNQAFANEQLTQGVGQFGQLPISPTGLNVGEAAITGVVGAIPRALSLAATGAAIGAAGGTAVAPGLGTAGGAAIGAAAGFVSGLAGAMIGSFKSQRSDTTTAQQRVLDEGKQTMKDWATLAKNDPAHKERYLAEYNKQSAQIDQAYRQMKLDTSRDVAKFETALPNLAEFESFYSSGGERDTLDIEMRTSIQAQSPPNYDMLELSFRRGKNDKQQ